MTANPPNMMKPNAEKRWNVNFHADIHIKCHAIKLSGTLSVQPLATNSMNVATNARALVGNVVGVKYMKTALGLVERCFLVVTNASILATTYVLRVVRNASISARTEPSVKENAQKNVLLVTKNVKTDVSMLSVTRNAMKCVKVLLAIRNVERCLNVVMSALAYVANNVFV